MRLSVCLVVAAVVAGAAGCGGLSADDEPEIPPLTAEPGDPQAGRPTVSLEPGQARAARGVLQRYLRAVGAGDDQACTYLSPEYESAAFGAQGCQAGLGQARREMDEADLAALRTVRVPGGEAGPARDEFTVRFADLVWAADPARPGGLVEARYVLRLGDGGWRLRG